MKRIIQILVTAQFALAMSLQICAQGPTIPQLVGSGPYESTFIHETGVPDLETLVRKSDLIIHCRILSKTSHLSEDERHIFTDYLVEPLGAFKIPDNNNVPPSINKGELLVRRQGGKLLVNGKEFLELDQNFPEFKTGEGYVLFLYKEKNNDQLMVYGGAQGAFRVVNGSVNHVDRLGFKGDQIRNVDYHAFADRLAKKVAEEKNRSPKAE